MSVSSFCPHLQTTASRVPVGKGVSRGQSLPLMTLFAPRWAHFPPHALHTWRCGPSPVYLACPGHARAWSIQLGAIVSAAPSVLRQRQTCPRTVGLGLAPLPTTPRGITPITSVVSRLKSMLFYTVSRNV